MKYHHLQSRFSSDTYGDVKTISHIILIHIYYIYSNIHFELLRGLIPMGTETFFLINNKHHLLKHFNQLCANPALCLPVVRNSYFSADKQISHLPSLLRFLSSGLTIKKEQKMYHLESDLHIKM